MKKLIFLALIVGACQPKEKALDQSNYPSELQKVFAAHGGYEQWEKMQSLSYGIGEGETQFISLKDRKVVIKSPARVIGYDGEQVWVMPDTADVQGARFYHNLYFYFFAMPFVLGDPGIVYEEMPAKTIDSEELQGIKIAYGQEIGDSPNDSYIIWYDPETYLMKWLMYNSTYHSGEPSDQYNLIKYGDWVTVNDLKLATSLKWFEYKKDSIGAVRGEAIFSNVLFSEKVPDFKIFEMPEGAQVAPGPEGE